LEAVKGMFWRLLEADGGFWRLLEVAGGCWRLLEADRARCFALKLWVASKGQSVKNVNVNYVLARGQDV
jgi:hypothetical protein